MKKFYILCINIKLFDQICLPEANSKRNYTGLNAVVAGWGRIGYQQNVSDILQEATMKVWVFSFTYDYL